MKPITYRNKKTPEELNFIPPLHLEQPRGYAYETDTHFVHIYGIDSGLYTISPGLTVIEGKAGTLEAWVKNRFGAEQIEDMNNDIGEVKKCIWRPGLFFEDEIKASLAINDWERHEAEQALIIIFEKLIDLFSYIEPNPASLDKVYSHRLRELLILACTEFENQCVTLMKKLNISPKSKNYITADYICLLQRGFLDEYSFSFPAYSNLSPFTPFAHWGSSAPTQSLGWYNNYNETKHDRSANFDKATLNSVINAVLSNIVLHVVRFGPYSLHNNQTKLTSIWNQYVHLILSNPNPRTFYIPEFCFPPDKGNDGLNDIFIFDPYAGKLVKKWNAT